MPLTNTATDQASHRGILVITALLLLAPGLGASGQVFVAVEVGGHRHSVQAAVGWSSNRDLTTPCRAEASPAAAGWGSVSEPARLPPRRMVASSTDWQIPGARRRSPSSPDAVVCYVSRPFAPVANAPVASIHPPGRREEQRSHLPLRRYTSSPAAEALLAAPPRDPVPATSDQLATPRRPRSSAIDTRHAYCDDDFRQLERLLDAGLTPSAASDLIDILLFVLHADLADLGEQSRRDPSPWARSQPLMQDRRDADLAVAGATALSVHRQITTWRRIAERLEGTDLDQGVRAVKLLNQLDQLEQQIAGLVADDLPAAP